MFRTILIALLLLPTVVAADNHNSEHPCFEINPNAQPEASVAACTDYILAEAGHPQDLADAHSNRGVALRELGQLDASLAELQRAVELDERTDHLRMLAWSLREAGRPEHAEEIYTRVLSIDDHWQGWLSRCVVRQDMERWSDAVPDCREALAREPENIDALFFTARALNFLGDGQGALPLAQKGRNLAPNDPRHAVEEVWATYFLVGTQAARRLAQQHLVRFESNSDLLHFLSTAK